MLIRRFLNWADQVSAGERAEGTAALALAYLYADLDPLDQGEAERALTILLDDPSPIVRRAMAEAFAAAVDAPHHIVVTLAADQSDIAAVILGRSPVLTDAELIDAVAVGDCVAQTAVASRPKLSAGVAGALAEVGQRGAALALCRNAAARISDFSAHRLLERFAGDGEIRVALADRNDLAPGLRHQIMIATAEALANFVTDRAWVLPERMRRITNDERDRATVSIAARSYTSDGDFSQRRFAAYLLRNRQLSAALLLRSLLSGQLPLFEAALCELSGNPAARVAGLVRNWGGLGFTALYKKAGLPILLLSAFRTALAALEDHAIDLAPGTGARLQRRLIEPVIAACAAAESQDLAKLLALLRRFEAEAAREDARGIARDFESARSAEAARPSELPAFLAAA